MQGEITTASTSIPCANNTAFFGGPQGNTTIAGRAAGCAVLANDFNMVEALAQAELTSRNQPLQVWAQFIQNNEADDLDTGWLAGFNWGKAGNPQTWEFGYAYGVIEKDAQFGQFVDSDFGGGVTDVDGSIFKLRLCAGQELGAERHVLHEQPLRRRAGRDRTQTTTATRST